MAIEVEVQNESSFTTVPGEREFVQWAAAALGDRDEAALTIRIVDAGESRELNRRYRHRDAPTNVLSFPADLPAEVGLPVLGDIVICAPLVGEEAAAQAKPIRAHWAHLTIHGVLHLLGFDHQQPEEAERMESLETRLLATLGFSDPYQET